MLKFQSGSGFVFGNAEFLVVQLCPEIKCTPRFFFELGEGNKGILSFVTLRATFV